MRRNTRFELNSRRLVEGSGLEPKIKVFSVSDDSGSPEQCVQACQSDPRESADGHE